MKCPRSPTKPYAPYKPNPPPKEIEKQTNLGTLTSQEDTSFNLQWFVDHINENYPSVDSATVKFSMEINKEYGYYDDVSTSLSITFYTITMIDNPSYPSQYKNYQTQLEKYHFDYDEYQKKLKQYKLDEKKYKEEVELWQVEHAKLILSRHDKKKIPASKKAIGSKK